MNCKVSIIVPVYNTEKFLPRCIASILSQSFKDFELILINDGSSDLSGDICDKVALNDNRVTVVHKINEGVSIARNTGLSVTQGEWITFVDSDDYLDIDYLSKLVKYSYYVDCVMMPIYIVKNGNLSIIDTVFNEDSRVNSRVIFEKTTLFLKRSASIYSKLYRRNVIEKYSISFIEHTSLYEDAIFNINYFMYCNHIFYLNTPGYYYVKYENPSSLCSRKKIPMNEPQITLNALINIYKKIQNRNDISNITINYCNQIIYKNLFLLIRCFVCLKLSKEKWQKEKATVVNIIKQIKVNTFKQYIFKCAANILYNNHFIYSRISNILNKE